MSLGVFGDVVLCVNIAKTVSLREFSRAEKFSEGSFFGRPFEDPINKQHMESNYVPSWIGQVNVSFSGQHVAWGKEIW